MVFSSLEFLFFFLPIVIIGYIVIKPGLANSWLLLCSLVFYFWGDRDHFLLLIAVIGIAYFAGLLIQTFSQMIIKRIVMWLSVFAMIAVMGYYKYWDFMISNINRFLRQDLPLRDIVFPVGISFFVFQAISYVVDVYRGEKALANPIDMGLYISFFPQLIAGPIVRFHDIRQFMGEEHRHLKIENFENGIWRFCIGLSKKVLLANNLGGLVAIVFAVQDISQFSVLYTWLGAIAYTFQIYFDFSGYSDMAIGLGRVFGFQFQENFNYPYMAKSVKDFWRRWHISLSQFFRDYIYIPLGGNRCSKIRWIFNMMIVWVLTGLWHGAAWHYILWGIFYGCILILKGLLPIEKKAGVLASTIQHIFTALIIISLWVLFRADGVLQAVAFLKNMYGIGSGSFIDHAFVFQIRNFVNLLIISLIFSFPIVPYLEKKLQGSKIFRTTETLCLMLCTLSAISYIYMGSYNPFLYFMF